MGKLKPEAPASAPPTPPPATETIAKEPVTKEQAWETCAEMKRADVTDSMLAKTWTKTIKKIVPKDMSEADITGEMWRDIQDEVLDVVFAKSPSK